MCARTFDQLFLVGYYLHGFSEALRDAGAPVTAGVTGCTSPDGAACRGHITCRAAAIEAQSEALCAAGAGAVDRVQALHRDFFTVGV